MKKILNILIVDDSKIFIEGITLLLQTNPNINNIYKALDYNSTLDQLKANSIDIVILDLHFETKEFDGLRIAKKIKQQYAHIKVMILTQQVRKRYYNKLINEYDVDAYLDKKLGIDETFRAIESVMQGEKYIDKNISNMLDIVEWMKISPREEDVVELLVQGLTYKEMADQLHISIRTVEGHIANLLRRFDVKNSVELVAKYVKYKNANREDIDGSTPPFKQ